MYKSTSGAWYGYFADQDIRKTGLPIPQGCGDGDACEAAVAPESLVRKAPPATAAGRTLHFFDLDKEFDIVYRGAPDEQAVSMKFGDPDASVGLDGVDYAPGASVAITIDDYALNVDPTSEDVWYLNTGGAPSYGSSPAGPKVLLGVEEFGLDASGILKCANKSDCLETSGVPTRVKFTEDGPNESTFTNTANDTPSLAVAATAPRGLSFSVEYGSTATSDTKYSTADIVIDAGGQWNSGQEIGITLTERDANTNSLDADDLSIKNSNQIIPTIRVGNPFTLAEADSVWLFNSTNGTRVAHDITEISDILVLNGTDGDGNRLSIRLGGWGSVAGYFPQNEKAFRGAHMINYDISALENASMAYLVIGDKKFPLVNAADGTRGTKLLNGPGLDAATGPFGSLYDGKGDIRDFGNAMASLEIGFSSASSVSVGDSIVIDIFSFGLENGNDNVNNAIYRLELEEDGKNSSNFVGTLEYVGLNQINILEASTYEGIEAFGDSIILISDDDSIGVEYRDIDATGTQTRFRAVADTPTRSGSVSFDSGGYKVSDTVTVTVEDADLNGDSKKADIYTTYQDRISSRNAVMELLSISIDGNDWVAGCGGVEGPEAAGFTLRETGNDSGVFEGTFAMPAEYCADGKMVPVAGADITARYVDFRDESGSTITVSDSAAIRSTTGAVGFDRTVYPVPFEGGASFGTHKDPLPRGDLTAYVRITDADFDTSPDRIDSIGVDGKAPLKVSVIRGSTAVVVGEAGDRGNAITETAPDSGVFEHEVTITHDMGPESGKCPAGSGGCILQGDVLHAEYEDPFDASGSENTVTDSATFDLRNGVLQSDQTAYIIGSDMILTLIEPDLDLDGGSMEAYTLDLIGWDSDAGTCTLAGTGCGGNPFDAVPSSLLETGNGTGIFQVVVRIPGEIGGDKIERGEEITLEYADWGSSGSDYVGDKDWEVTTRIYTSNLGATVELDQRVYTWTDKVYVAVVAPDHNIDAGGVDEIGVDDDYPVRVSTRGHEIGQYKLVETGADTGIFTGEVILTGFVHDADGDGRAGDSKPHTSEGGSGPTDGRIGTGSESGISVSFRYSEGETASASAPIRWNVGEVQWLGASYADMGSGIVRVVDPDMNLNPEAVDSFKVTVWSDSDGGGIDLTVTETNEATGIFEGTVFFGPGADTGGHRLRVAEGDTVTAQYHDNTLPAPFKESEGIRVGATAMIGTAVPPLERVSVSGLRAVDSLGNTLEAVPVGTQIQIAADLTGLDGSQDFAYLVQIQDEGGVTVSLGWITGSLAEEQSLGTAVSWTPTEAGTYDVTAFVWESVENPTALSPTSTMAIVVT